MILSRAECTGCGRVGTGDDAKLALLTGVELESGCKNGLARGLCAACLAKVKAADIPTSSDEADESDESDDIAYCIDHDTDEIDHAIDRDMEATGDEDAADAWDRVGWILSKRGVALDAARLIIDGRGTDEDRARYEGAIAELRAGPPSLRECPRCERTIEAGGLHTCAASDTEPPPPRTFIRHDAPTIVVGGIELRAGQVWRWPGRQDLPAPFSSEPGNMALCSPTHHAGGGWMARADGWDRERFVPWETLAQCSLVSEPPPSLPQAHDLDEPTRPSRPPRG